MSDLLKDLADIRDRIDLAMDAVRGKAAAPADEVGEPKAIGCPRCKLIYERDGNRMFFCPRHGDDPEQSSIVGIGRNGTETRWWTHLLGPDVEPLWSGLKLAVTAGFVALTPHQQKFAATTAEKRAALGKPEAKEPAPPASELLPCPFCGSWPVFHMAHGDDSISLTCPNADCGAYKIAHHHESRKQAIAAWNRRSPSQPDAVVKAALEVVEADRLFDRGDDTYSRLTAARKAYAAAVDGAGKGAANV